MRKTAAVTYPVHELIAERWSPRAFASKPIDKRTVGSLLEAARWAPSSWNGQPWRFLVALRDDKEGFERMAACLVEGNAWAKQASVLMLSVARLAFEQNEKPNRHAFHDVGLAAENLVLQAQALGLASHQMAGFVAERARETLAIPAGFDPVAMFALGYPGDPDSLPPDLAKREHAPRERKPLSEIAFGPKWGSKLGL